MILRHHFTREDAVVVCAILFTATVIDRKNPTRTLELNNAS